MVWGGGGGAVSTRGSLWILCGCEMSDCTVSACTRKGGGRCIHTYVYCVGRSRDRACVDMYIGTYV